MLHWNWGVIWTTWRDKLSACVSVHWCSGDRRTCQYHNRVIQGFNTSEHELQLANIVTYTTVTGQHGPSWVRKAIMEKFILCIPCWDIITLKNCWSEIVREDRSSGIAVDWWVNRELLWLRHGGSSGTQRNRNACRWKPLPGYWWRHSGFSMCHSEL
jgi:hypothetical protein